LYTIKRLIILRSCLLRRKQAGVYTSYMFGPEGKRVKVNLLCHA
jgi:hypothetical protein